jgi:hypothetical protein
MSKPVAKQRGHGMGRAHLWIRHNILGLVAIFIALGGTAFAAQVAGDHGKAHVAKKKKVKAGPPGPAGPQGIPGTQGIQGVPGANGAAGVTPGGIIPSGATLRGVWAPFGEDSSGGAESGQGVSFGGFSLTARPLAHVIPVGGAPTTQCPGSSATPSALSGHLCLYIATTGGTPTSGDQLIVLASDGSNGLNYNTFTNTVIPIGDGKVDLYGFTVGYANSGSNISQAAGTWAVTG